MSWFISRGSYLRARYRCNMTTMSHTPPRIVIIPRILHEFSFDRVLKQIASLKEARVVIDARSTEYATPFGLLGLVSLGSGSRMKPHVVSLTAEKSRVQWGSLGLLSNEPMELRRPPDFVFSSGIPEGRLPITFLRYGHAPGSPTLGELAVILRSQGFSPSVVSILVTAFSNMLDSLGAYPVRAGCGSGTLLCGATCTWSRFPSRGGLSLAVTCPAILPVGESAVSQLADVLFRPQIHDLAWRLRRLEGSIRLRYATAMVRYEGKAYGDGSPFMEGLPHFSQLGISILFPNPGPACTLPSSYRIRG